jgi:D-lyxose ketol-isomerase
VTVSLEGVRTELPPGERVVLGAGQSIWPEEDIYHEFRADGGPTLIGGASAVNDDARDNRFAEPTGCLPEIEEDEPPLHYLCNECPPAG